MWQGGHAVPDQVPACWSLDFSWPVLYIHVHLTILSSHSWGVSVCNLWLVMVTTYKTGMWDSSVIIVTRVVARCLKDCSVIPYRGKASRPILGHTRSHIQWVPGVFTGVKQQGHKT